MKGGSRINLRNEDGLIPGQQSESTERERDRLILEFFDFLRHFVLWPFVVRHCDSAHLLVLLLLLQPGWSSVIGRRSSPVPTFLSSTLDIHPSDGRQRQASPCGWSSPPSFRTIVTQSILSRRCPYRNVLGASTIGTRLLHRTRRSIFNRGAPPTFSLFIC